MTDPFSDLVLPIFQDVLDLKFSLSWPQPPTPNQVMQTTQDCIDKAAQRAQADPRLAAEFDLTKYGLVAWIDEILTDSPWGQQVGWGSTGFLLEWNIYRTNLRAGRFYQEADFAYNEVQLGHSSTDPLEAYLVCVALGFRGGMAQSRPSLDDWIEKFYAKVSESSPLASKPFADDPAEGAARGLAPRLGASLLLTVSILSALTAVTTAVAYMLAVYVGYQPNQ